MFLPSMELVRDEEGEVPLELTMQFLEAARVHAVGEDAIPGVELCRRGKLQDADLGQQAARWVYGHSDQIPRELQSYHLVFLATVWKDRSENEYMVYLAYSEGRWYLEYGALTREWNAYCRVMKLKRPEEG